MRFPSRSIHHVARRTPSTSRLLTNRPWASISSQGKSSGITRRPDQFCMSITDAGAKAPR
ncbi:MAG: hypothetical protein ACRDL3_10540 [Solirubrobacterales bacterium]